MIFYFTFQQDNYISIDQIRSADQMNFNVTNRQKDYIFFFWNSNLVRIFLCSIRKVKDELNNRISIDRIDCFISFIIHSDKSFELIVRIQHMDPYLMMVVDLQDNQNHHRQLVVEYEPMHYDRQYHM